MSIRALPLRRAAVLRAKASMLAPVLALVGAVAIGGLGGCASTGGAVDKRIALSPIRVVGEPVGPDALDVYDAEILFARGLDLLDGDAWSDAALYFERLVREFPDDARVVLAHYNRGVAYIHLERGNDAVDAFDAYLALLPPTASKKDRLDGTFKRVQALAVAKRYEEVVTLFDELLGENLEPEDRIEALLDAGVGHYMLGLRPGGEEMHRPTSEYRFLEARRIYKKESEKRRIDHLQFFVAQASFYLGELARLEFNELKLTIPSAKDIEERKQRRPEAGLEALLGEQLEEKCQRLLRAQYAYLRTIREGDAGWASAACFSVGQMYEDLHHEMVNLPPPEDLTTEQSSIYRQLVRRKVLILLEKAEKTWGQTAEMVTRTGAESEWAQRTRESLNRVHDRIVAEAAATADLDDDRDAVAGAGGASGSS